MSTRKKLRSKGNRPRRIIAESKRPDQGRVRGLARGRDRAKRRRSALIRIQAKRTAGGLGWRGAAHWNATLTDHEVDLIRALHEDEEQPTSVAALAEKFEVSKSTVWRIVRYKSRAFR